METELESEKIALIKKWLEEGQVVPPLDIQWAVQEIEALKAKAEETEKTVSELKTTLIKAGASNQACRHALTMWLAVRGSNSEEFFIATKGLAAQTTKALNE